MYIAYQFACKVFVLTAILIAPSYCYAQLNKNKNSANGIDIAALALETPWINMHNKFVAHYVDVDGRSKLNYVLEWNARMRHSQWVAYRIDRSTLSENKGRCNCFDVDPSLPASMQTDNNHHRRDGFDRGHLCPSADRQRPEEANRQTFYFSNMSPQINSFNSGIWQRMEKTVSRWGTLIASGKYDTLYVAKGGTLDKLLKNFEGVQKHSDGRYPTTDSNGFTVNGLPCPAYYFMAVLAVKDGKYKSIAFCVQHAEQFKKKNTAAEVKALAVSVDELERMTGLDFFCNLPDDIEKDVESQLNLSDWKW